MQVRNRWFLLFAGVCSVTLVLAAACGSSKSSADKTKEAGGKTPSATSTGGTTADLAPTDQQKITIQFVEPKLIDPDRASFEQEIGIIRMLWRALYNLTDDGKGGTQVDPGMAAGDPTVSGNVYTVKLKDGLKWSDGQPVTAQNFVDGAKRGCDVTISTEYGYLWGDGYLDLKGCAELQANKDASKTQSLKDALAVRAIDDKTIEYTLNKPNGRFTTIMAIWVTFPVRMDVITAKGDAWTDPANIVGNGPFVLKSYTRGDSMTFAPNPNWAGKKPALQEVKLKFLDDFSAAFRSYQSGDLAMTRINATDAATAKSQGLEKQTLIEATARISWLEMQLKNEALSKFDVRLALSRAIDRDALNQAVFDGVNTPAHYWVVKGLTGYQGDAPFKDIVGYNPTEAKAALARAGYPNGQGFPELKIVVNTPERKAAAEFLQQQFKEILGITVTPDQVDGQTRSARFRSEDFQLFIGGWQLDYPDIENPLHGLFETGGGNNHYNCSNPDVDAALQKALAATNDEGRIKGYQEMETAIVKNLCGGAPIWQDSVPYLVNSKIGGVVANGVIDSGLPGNYCVECWYVKKS